MNNLETQSWIERYRWWILGAVLFAGFGLRFAASIGDLWFDEIWSIELSRLAENDLELITQIRHDNNHILNSFFLRRLDQSPEWVLRLPVVILGTLAILVSYWIGIRKSTTSGLCFATLVSCSHFLIHYSSEARGYGYAIFFALLSHLCFLKLIEFANPKSENLEGPGKVDDGKRVQSSRARVICFYLVLFLVSTILGFLSHLTYVVLFLAQFVYGALLYYFQRIDESGLGWLGGIGFAPSLLFFIWLYRTHYQGMQIGGGDDTSLWGVILQTPFAFAGAVSMNPFSLLSGVIFLMMLFLAVLRVYRQDRLSFYFLTVLTSAMLGGAIVNFTGLLYVRYFAILLPFLFLVIAEWLPGERSIRLSWLGLTVFVVLNLLPTMFLIQNGRGNYREAIELISNSDKSEKILVGTDHKDRTEAICNYYFPRVSTKGSSGDRQFLVSDSKFTKARWYLLQPKTGEPSEEWVSSSGRRYQLRKVFWHFGFSGWGWALYEAVGEQKKPGTKR